MADVGTPGITTSPEKLSCYGMSFEWGVEATTQIWAGSAIAVMPDGYLAPSDTAGALFTVGRAAQSVLGTTAGALTCRFDQGIFRWVAGSNPPLVANRGQICYWQDDQTVTMTPGTLAAGIVEAVDSQGVWVLTALGVGGGGDAAGSPILVQLLVADLVSADASVYYCTSPIAGVITNIQAIVQGHALATGNATLTGKIGTTAITGGVVTLVNASSAVGDVFNAAPTAANTVAVGSKINFTVGGTQTNAAAQANLILTIQP